MAVRRAIIGPGAVITEDIRTLNQNLNCQVINPLSSDALRKPKIAESRRLQIPETNSPGVRCMLYGNAGSAANRRMIKTMSRIVLITSSSSDDL